MSNVGLLVKCMDEIAPTRFAAEWDNVGLLVGSRNAPLKRVLLCIDLTPEVYREAKSQGVQGIIAYHPPIFKPVATITEGSIAFDAVRDSIAIYSPHTALDAASGGTNDILADAVGIVSDARRVSLKAPTASENACKLVTFVPAEAVEKVSEALFAAGAGKIGHYTQCSFRTPGEGTFFGDPTLSNPAVGEAGKRETVSEIRVETVVPLRAIEAVVRALRASHPYETPAYDLLRLHAEPEHLGFGRVGPLTEPAALSVVVDRLKQALSLDHLLVAGDPAQMIRTAAVGAGATGELLGDALRARVDLFVLGEMRHHDALRAVKAKTAVVMTLHSNSERVTLKNLATRLGAKLEGVEFLLSSVDRDPFVVR